MLKFIFLFILSSILGNKIFGQIPSRSLLLNCSSDTSFVDSLFKLDYKAFEGHSVDSLINALPKRFTKKGFLGGSRVHIIGSAYFIYHECLYISIYVRNFKFMNPVDYTMKWDWELFKKEIITHVSLSNQEKCIKNCDPDNYLE